MVYGSWFMVYCVGFRVRDLEFKVQGLGTIKVLGFGSKVQGLDSKVQGPGGLEAHH